MNPIWEFRESINPLAKDLIQKLTTIEPIERYSVGQALIHPWITRNFMDKIPLTYNE
jgi:calcium/calmodulin-dependent protein kinase I